MSTITLYGIKNCDTVKKAIKWCEANNVDATFHDFRKQGIEAAMVSEWLTQIPLDKLINKRSTTWKQLDDATKESLSEETAPALCAEHETLIKRPLLDVDGSYFCGFSDKTYSEIFN